MKFFLTLNRIKIVAIFFFVIILIFILGQISEALNPPLNADTNARRLEYAASRGIDVEEECVSVKETVIPDTFSDTYKNYNEIQKSVGLDLSAYKGCKVTVYKYKLKNKDNTYLTLIVYHGRVIGGDVADISLNGKMTHI